MRIRGCLLLAAVAGFACDGDEDPTAACRGEHAIQVFSSAAHGDQAATSRVYSDDAWSAEDRTYITQFAENTSHVGRGCGAALSTIEGLTLAPPTRDADADIDPAIVCDRSTGQLYRIDVDGDDAPQLVLPHLRCPGDMTRHGPLFETRLADRALWFVPDFPDDSTAVAIGADVMLTQIVGDLVYHLDDHGALARTDLVTGASQPLIADVAWFQATTSHVLVRSNIDLDVAPMLVLDIAAGTAAGIGLYHDDEDRSIDARTTTGLAWSFDPTGAYVVHAGVFPTPMAAFDLAGRPAAFPALGESVRVHPNGTHVVCDGETIVAARPGDPHTPRLDFANCRYAAFVDDHLEALIDGDLYHVPLDGGPRSLLAREIGPSRAWLDDKHILTVTGGQLVAVLAATNLRRSHAGSVVSFHVAPDGGVFYDQIRPGEPASNGIWFLPRAGLYPRTPPCLTGYYCR